MSQDTCTFPADLVMICYLQFSCFSEACGEECASLIEATLAVCWITGWKGIDLEGRASGITGIDRFAAICSIIGIRIVQILRYDCNFIGYPKIFRFRHPPNFASLITRVMASILLIFQQTYPLLLQQYSDSVTALMYLKTAFIIVHSDSLIRLDTLQSIYDD